MNGIPIIGGFFNAQAIKEQDEQVAQALWRDKELMEKNAEIAREAGAYNAARQQDSAFKAFGATRADYAASGVTQDSGSVVDILRESYANAELDRLNIIHGAEMDALDYENKASGLHEQVDAVRRTSGKRQLAALLGGFSQAASNSDFSSGKSKGESDDESPTLNGKTGARTYKTYNNSDYMEA